MPQESQKSAGHPRRRVAFNGAKIVTKEEMIAAINECAARLGHAPSSTELRKSANVNKYDIRKYFGTHIKALDACGMEARGRRVRSKAENPVCGLGGGRPRAGEGAHDGGV